MIAINRNHAQYTSSVVDLQMNAYAINISYMYTVPIVALHYNHSHLLNDLSKWLLVIKNGG